MVIENEPCGQVVGAVMMVLILNENVTGPVVETEMDGLILQIYKVRMDSKGEGPAQQYRLDCVVFYMIVIYKLH